MSARSLTTLLCIIITAISMNSCRKNSEVTTGELRGIVEDATTTVPLENTSVVIFNADNNSPIGQTLKTDQDGVYSVQLPAGNYFLKFSRQGYYPVPPATLEAVPFSVINGQVTENDAEMFPYSNINTGWIEGTVTTNGNPVQGALVVASDNLNQSAFSTSSDKGGNFSIFNVPAGTFDVKAFLSSFNSNSIQVSVNMNTATKGINIEMAKTANASLTGNIRNLAIENKDVDITFVHPITKETIPGLTTTSSGLAYSMNSIPNGTFIARATYKNDLRVMDPDRIAKFGEPLVNVSNGTCSPSTLTFDITGPVSLSTPTNLLNSTIPVETVTRPLFQWTPYPSTTDYVIEVMDASTGQVVWGGFDKSGSLPVKNISIPGVQSSINYNMDGKAAITDLIPGKTYRWRVYASKNDVNSSTGWTLISSSEDQMGLIKIGAQ